MGTGTDVSQGEVINVQDENFHTINSIGLSTGYDSPGEWVFGDLDGTTNYSLSKLLFLKTKL